MTDWSQIFSNRNWTDGNYVVVVLSGCLLFLLTFKLLDIFLESLILFNLQLKLNLDLFSSTVIFLSYLHQLIFLGSDCINLISESQELFLLGFNLLIDDSALLVKMPSGLL